MEREGVWAIPITADFLRHISMSRKQATNLYSYALKKYANWLKTRYGKEVDYTSLTLDDLNPSDIESFLSTYENPYTYNSYLQAFRGIAKYVWKKIIPKNYEEYLYLHRFATSIEMIRQRETPKYFSREALNEEEVESLLLETSENEDVFVATVVHFYFGSRPSELVYRFVETHIDLQKVGELIKRYGRAMLDKNSKLACIPISKTKTRVKILPYKPIAEYFEYWVEMYEKIKGYSTNRENEWYTKRVKTYARRLGLKVTAKTARKTFETQMRFAGVEQWMISYWLGHKTSIPDIYTDYNLLLPIIEKEVVSKHYLLKILEKF